MTTGSAPRRADEVRRMAASDKKMLRLDHDELIAALIALRDQLPRAQVARAFVRSLRARRLDLRSALGSYAFHLNHPPHALEPFDPSGGTARYLACERCGYFSNT